MARRHRHRSKDWGLPLAGALAEALHASGAPAHLLEAEVQRVLGARGLTATVMATPTALWVQAGERTSLLRLPPAGTDLGRLQRVQAVADALVAGRLDPEAATRALRGPVEGPYPAGIEASAFAATSAGAAVLLGGGGVDVVLAAGLGVVVWLAAGELSARPAWGGLASGVAALLAGGLAALAAPLGAHPPVLALAAIIVLAPGLQLALGLAEVAAGHWTAGTARLSAAMTTSLQLAAGLTVGASLAPEGAAVSGPPVPLAASWGVLPLAGAAIAVLCRVHPRQIPAAAATAVVAWLAASLLPGPAGAGLGALVATLAGNAAARAWGWAPAVLTVPGVLLLVPGSVGVRGVGELLADQLLPGLGLAVAAGLGAGGIAVGMLLGHALVPSVR